MPAALTFDRVTKRYRGAAEYRALRDDLVGAAARLVGQGRAPRAVVTALDDVSLEIPEGQSFGLIGVNGAGKTTALKLATRIAYPTTGRIRVRGRVGALIEVGSGMHPELTGRENVGLHGRILGLTARDVALRFDDIVEFAGIGAAIDQPVKQYSSGMQLRLGFSIAAHLEPDVLLVDEAIAVGDAGFQYRCVERMRDLVREGRTLVFVSHDMTAIETLCDRAVLLADGSVAEDGPARDVVAAYLRQVRAARLQAGLNGGVLGDGLQITAVEVLDEHGRERAVVEAGRSMTVRVHFRAGVPIAGPMFSVGLVDPRIGCFASASMLLDGAAPERISGEGTVDCVFLDVPLAPRVYEIWGTVRGELGHGTLIDWQRLRFFEVADDGAARGKGAVSVGEIGPPVRLPYRWDVRSEAEGAPEDVTP